MSENENVQENEEVVAEVIEAEADNVISESDSKGINISEEVVATIAGMAAQEVKGVAALNASGISEMFGMKTKGVKVQVGEKDTVIDVSLTIDYGARIPDIAWEVQNKVKTQVEGMTGLNVVAVNVHVQGVVMPKKKNEKQIEDKPQEQIEEAESESAQEEPAQEEPAKEE